MDHVATLTAATPAIPASDLRRAISRQTWLANRARNALQRPAFIGATSVATFVTALVSLIVVPRTKPPTKIPVIARPDTLAVMASAQIANTRLAQAESTLNIARQRSAEVEAQRAADSLGATMGPRRDSLIVHARTLERLLLRAEQAPLPTSYRALADLPEMRDDARVRALVDSLSDIEREREGIGAVGGVDPIFVALTSRANDIGRAIKSIASERLRVVQTELTNATPTASTGEVPTIDTLAPLAVVDSASTAIRLASDSLAVLRHRSQELDLAEERARERASAVAPPLALLASAFVLSAVIGFATAFVGEIRRPRVSDANELERFLGVRVLSTVETPMPSAERGRREADRLAPPYFDPGAEGYQLAYLGLATEHPALLSATITGDEMAVAAVVTCNLAAIAAEEARSTLVLDAETTCSASAALRARVSPGLIDILQRGTSWADARVAARVGREKSVDLVPFGLDGAAPPANEIAALLRRDAGRLSRYYDAIFVLARPQEVASGLPATLPAPDVVYCAQPGITPLRNLRTNLQRIRASGGQVRGVVLWNAPRPLLPTPRELTSRKRAKRTKARAAAPVSS
ncbi:MAG TPA: hypothetical protein VFT29_13075 [Gemmatimonadaceae bacterium]|nr:hypothetical protein [Gemmatimonadaceae bacterium]